MLEGVINGDDTEHWYDYHRLRNRERFALALIDDEPKGSSVDLGCGSGHLVVKMKIRQLMC